MSFLQRLVFRWGSRSVGALLAFVTILIWSSSTAVSKIVLSSLSSLQVMFFFSLSTVIVFVPLLFYWKKIDVMRSFSLWDWLVLFGMGFLGVFLYIHLFNLSIVLLPAQVAAVVHYMWPLFTVFFSLLFFRSSISWSAWAGLAISFAGVLILVSNGEWASVEGLSLLGLLFAFGSALSYGLFSALVKNQEYDPIISTFCYFLVSLILSYVLGFSREMLPPLEMVHWLSLVWLGPIVSGLGFVLWLTALRMGSVALASNIALLAPFLALVYIFFLVGEPIAWTTIVGAIFVVAGIYVHARTRDRA